MVGIFTAHPKGFGFVSVEGEDEDIFIPEANVGDALHMDKVQVVVSPRATGRRREGTIIKVLDRGMKQIVCTYEQSKNFGFAVPDNPRFGSDIFIPLERSKGAVKGHKVVVLNQSFEDETNTVKVIDPSYAWIIPTGSGEKPVKIAFEGQTIVDEYVNYDRSREVQVYKKVGVGIVATDKVFTYTIDAE